MAFAEFGSWNGHTIKIFRPVRRIVRRAIVPPGPREKRHLRNLGVAGGRRDCLDSDDLLLLPGVTGATLSKLLNSAFALPAFKKAATPATFSSLACCLAPPIFLYMAMSRSQSNVIAHLRA